MSVSTLAAALAYAKHGWHVFPAPPDSKKSYKCAKHAGKRPLAEVGADFIEIGSRAPRAPIAMYRDKFQTRPPRSWDGFEPLAPTPATLRWIKHRQIAYAKRRSAA
jgi:hypothetical protein